MEKTFFQKIHEWFVKAISHIKWDQKKTLDDVDKAILRDALTSDYFIIATRRRNYLTSFFINLGHFLMTGRWGYFTHVLMNLEDSVNDDSDFRFIEATTRGTKYSTFEEVFGNVDGTALIKPRSMTLDEWTSCLDTAKLQLGKPYDNLFNVKNDLEVNCVELVRIALMALPDYHTRFANFEKMLKEKKTLTPDMFAECDDFHIYHMIRKF